MLTVSLVICDRDYQFARLHRLDSGEPALAAVVYIVGFKAFTLTRRGLSISDTLSFEELIDCSSQGAGSDFTITATASIPNQPIRSSSGLFMCFCLHFCTMNGF